LLFAFAIITANFSIALINFVPALPLDGGRILRAALTERYGYVKAFNTCIIITRILALVLAVLGIILLYATKLNFSVLIISAFLIVNCITEQRGSKLIMMKEILYSRQKLTDNGLEKSGVICIMKDAPARRALKHLTYNKYYIINLIDEDMNVLASVTETKLIEKLIVKGIRIKACEIFAE
jgi:stage IV sporulation protein FB